MKTALLTTLGILTLGAVGNLSAQSFVITDDITETVGITAVITDSGSKDNTATWALGTVGVFEMNGGAYFLKVSATGSSGDMVPGEDSLMVARTVNSQGLTDTGTLSVYVNTAPTESRWSLDLRFEFFSNIALTTPANVNLLLTSLDIDWAQRYYTSNTNFTATTLYPGTDITAAPAVTGYNGFTATGDSTFNNAEHAVSTFGSGNTFNVRLSHDTVALYMFEFRDPSSIVPEPGTAMLALGGVAVLGLMRRKVRRA